MITPKDQILSAFKELRLHYLLTHCDDFIARATKQNLSAMQILEEIVALEIEESKRRLIDARLRAAKLGRFSPLSDFNWNWPKKIPRQTIDQLFTLSFIDEPANVILIGTSGLGKSMIAKNLGYQAALSGRSVMFVEAADMLTDLGGADSPGLFKRRLSQYIRPKLLIIDEVGYLSHSTKSADILFQVVSKRHEKSATVITTNKAFADWGSVFPGSGCVVALIDRLTQCAEIIHIEGDSYRLKQAEERSKNKKIKKDKVSTHEKQK